MLLRPRQQVFVDRSVSALTQHGNTLGVAPTGAGKTVMLSAAAGEMLKPGRYERALILQHRDELVAQNRRTYHAINRGADTGVVDADHKEFHRPVVFAMVQTLARDTSLAAMRPADLLVIDEAHHAAANSYQKIITHARNLNPAVKLLGVTATPNRGDKKGLRGIFDNVADQITLGELIASGALVRPRTFVLDVGVQEELRHVRKTLSDFDMAAVEKIMDKVVLNDAIVAKWKELAGDRQTVVFCSTVDHARHLCEAFTSAGVAAGVVIGDGGAERERVLRDYDARKIQVVCNVAVLTEGWDNQPTSCVVLTRPSSYKSTMIQMVGRGLRRVDPERYPGVFKDDCIVLDFGISTLTHGSLEQDVNLDGSDKKGDAPTKLCPSCEGRVPLSIQECPICGHVFEPEADLEPGDGDVAKDTLKDFIMTEVDLFNASPFKWEDIWGDQSVLVASAFEAWAMAIFYQGAWHALGGATGKGITHLAAGHERMLAIAAADDFMRDSGDAESAAKTKRWLHLPATDRQLETMNMTRELAPKMTRYQAACKLTWKFNARGIQAKLQGLGRAVAA